MSANEMDDDALASPEALVATLEQSVGGAQRQLLVAGRERFRSALFNALLARARRHLSAGAETQGEVLLELAKGLVAAGANDQAKGKMCFAIGTTWHEGGMVEKAIPAYRWAAHYLRRADVLDGETRVLARWAQAVRAAGKLRAAIRLGHRARRQAKALGLTDLRGQVANNLGYTYLKAANYRKARTFLNEAILYGQLSNNAMVVCMARGNLGLAEFELGHYQTADVVLQEATACAQSLGDSRLESGHIGSLGNAKRALGQLVEAESCFRGALAIARTSGDRESEGLALGNLGFLLFTMGRMNEAIALLEESYGLSVATGQALHAAQDAYHLGIVYREVGDTAAARAALRDCLRLAEDAGEISLQAGCRQALAYLAMAEGDWAQAELHLQAADALDATNPDVYNAAALPLAWGFLAYQRNHYAEAEAQWGEALVLAKRAKNLFFLLTALLNRGAVLAMQQRFSEAKVLLHEALERAQSMHLPDDERPVWEALGFVHERQGEWAKACDCYRRALAMVEAGRGALATETHRIGFFGSRQGPYERLIRLLLGAGQGAEAWAVVEQARSRGYVDALAQTALRTPVTLPQHLIAVEQELLQTVRSYQRQIGPANRHQLPVLLNALAQAQARLQTLWEQMAEIPAAAEYVALRRGEPVSWPALQGCLSAHE
jgi:tetratricopeptide (TPR) repeat protein